MVKQIQFTDEYYELSDSDDDPLVVFSAPTYYTTDEQLVLIACLMLLEQRYRLLQSMTLQDIVDEIDDIMASFEVELTNTAYTRSSNHIRNYFNELLDEFSIPDGYVNMDTSMLDLMTDSLGTMINQLGGEIKVKSKFFRDNMSKDTFDLLPNFRRAVQKLVDAVGSNLIWGKAKSKDNVYEFVYGEDKLYRWLTMNDDKVCAWCRMQESLPPRTLREMPLDHIHGRCEKEPIDYTYSDEYYLMLARGEYAREIRAFTPEDEYMSQASGRRL